MRACQLGDWLDPLHYAFADKASYSTHQHGQNQHGEDAGRGIPVGRRKRLPHPRPEASARRSANRHFSHFAEPEIQAVAWPRASTPLERWGQAIVSTAARETECAVRGATLYLGTQKPVVRFSRGCPVGAAHGPDRDGSRNGGSVNSFVAIALLRA